MKFSEIIIAQTREIGIMWAAGMTIGLLHSLLFRGRDTASAAQAPLAAVLSFIRDILFWVLAALLASSFLYYCSFGRISFHAIAALAIGFAVWQTCFVTKKSQPPDPFCDIIVPTTKLRRRLRKR